MILLEFTKLSTRELSAMSQLAGGSQEVATGTLSGTLVREHLMQKSGSLQELPKFSKIKMDQLSSSDKGL